MLALLPPLAVAQTTDDLPFATGRWVKIAVPQTGIYELTDSLLTAAGFTDPSRVSLYGYGGALQPEELSHTDAALTQALPRVPLCTVSGRRLFYGVGPVNWATPQAVARTFNPYSRVGCYFLTEGDATPLAVDSAAFADTYYPSANDYHALYEVDDYAWYHGGRNLFDRQLFGHGVAHTYRLPTQGRRQGVVSIVMSYTGECDATVHLGDSLLGNILINKTTALTKQVLDSYMKAASDVWRFQVDNLPADSAVITIRQTSGASMRLDNIELRFLRPAPMPALTTATFAQPSIVGTVASQQRRADGPADMIIIVPASGLLVEQAERLAQLHRDHDGMRVRVVRADELYNEFSSGTSDIGAYRRYLKMLYDRAADEADKPRYLLLFGDAAYDNRLLTSDFSSLRADDMLLCYESENSVSETACYVSDDFIGMLDDGDGSDIIKSNKGDLAVGRLPVRTAEEAAVVVDKIIAYHANEHAGAWQNTLCFMGDDGNANMHMNDADAVAEMVVDQWPDYDVKKFYWDAYQRVPNGESYAYPDVRRLVLQQMQEGALLMNYSGHGAPISLSGEEVLLLNDFKQSTPHRLPLWFTASCDIAPFDGYLENIGEQALFNKDGGAIAFIGTTRTVYALHNRSMNQAFTRRLLELDGGRPRTIGEALRLAKNDQVLGANKTQQQAGINRLHFALLGDPALRLPLPTSQIVVDSIGGVSVDDGKLWLAAGDTATVVGHVEGDSQFSGVAAVTLYDAAQTITCRMNPHAGNEMPRKPLVYTDRSLPLFSATDSVSNGRFSVTIVVPKDISYADESGMLLVHAVSNDRQLTAHGSSHEFVMGSADSYEEGSGPIISAWLDSPSFVSGSHASPAPMLHADLYDDDGINAIGSGIGHHIELTIDGLMRYTYNLNSYFHYAFGDYRSGSLDFYLPHLDDGAHQLRLRAWDVLNNSSVLTLDFVTGEQLGPTAVQSVALSRQPSDLQCYDLQGRRVGPGQRQGLRLIRTADGRVKKIVVRRQ